jgi:hypothetical protein
LLGAAAFGAFKNATQQATRPVRGIELVSRGVCEEVVDVLPGFLNPRPQLALTMRICGASMMIQSSLPLARAIRRSEFKLLR